MIKNKASFKYSELAFLFGENNLVGVSENFHNNSVVTDSREVKNNDIFVALIGDNFDAHTKVLEAHLNGACAVVAKSDWYFHHYALFQEKYPFEFEKFKKISFILTKDTLEALGLLANFHRNRFDLPVIAVAGANGKTTTKEMVSKVLSKNFNVLSTYKNFNNQVGVPLMLLSLNETHSAAVIEIGTNSNGEIHKLSKILNPTYGVITNIGKEHLEMLEDLDGVEMEETALFAYLRKHLGCAFINADDNRLIKYTTLLENKVVFGQNPSSEIKADFEFDNNLIPTVTIDNLGIKNQYTLKEIGLGNAYASLIAFTIGTKLEVPANDIIEALQSSESDKNSDYGRMRVDNYKLNHTTLTLINDCYNANPSSVELALKTIKEIKANFNYTITVLGEMRELGEASFVEHTELLNLTHNITDVLFIYGKEFEKIDFLPYPYLTYFAEKTDLTSSLSNLINNKDLENKENNKQYKILVLLKGSRGNKLEEVLQSLISSGVLKE